MKTDVIKNRDELIQIVESGGSVKWLFFWGHTPARDGSVTQSCMSQWWLGHPFCIDGIDYPTAEHYMMAEKARLFDDEVVLSEILESTHPGDAKKLGRKVSGFDPAIWNKHRSEIVVRGNVAKFSQHPDLKTFLLNTKNRILVEASPRDRIWGIGMGKNNPDAKKPDSWRGLNLLGFALMEVRQQIVI